MSFFCLCTALAIVGDDKKGFQVDTYAVRDLDPVIFEESKKALVLPEHPMSASIGHRQFLANVPNFADYVKSGDIAREHFPGVDLFRCVQCGAWIARG